MWRCFDIAARYALPLSPQSLFSLHFSSPCSLSHCSIPLHCPACLPTLSPRIVANPLWTQNLAYIRRSLDNSVYFWQIRVIYGLFWLFYVMEPAHTIFFSRTCHLLKLTWLETHQETLLKSISIINHKKSLQQFEFVID